MGSPGLRPRNNKLAAEPGGKSDSPPMLRVLSDDGAPRTAKPNITMPRANTELSALLADDPLLCLRRRVSATATRQNSDLGPGMSGSETKPKAQLPAAVCGKQRSGDAPDLSPAQMSSEDLARVIDAWPRLPRNIRAAILALIRETTSGKA